MKLCDSFALLFVAACSTPPNAVYDAPVTPPPVDTAVPAVDTSPAPPKQQFAVLFAGQSNASNHGRLDLGSNDQIKNASDFALLAPYPAVPYATTIGVYAIPAPLYTYSGPLQAVLDPGGMWGFGAPITLGRALDAAMPGQWSEIQYAYGSTALDGPWAPGGNWPAAGSGNLFNQSVSFTKSTLATSGASLAAVVWVQGEDDTLSTYAAQHYEANLEAFIAATRSAYGLPNLPFFVARVNIAFCSVTGYGSAFPADCMLVRTAEANAVAATPNTYLIDQDGYPLLPNQGHYTDDAYLALGSAYAAAVLAVVH